MQSRQTSNLTLGFIDLPYLFYEEKVKLVEKMRSSTSSQLPANNLLARTKMKNFYQICSSAHTQSATTHLSSARHQELLLCFPIYY